MRHLAPRLDVELDPVYLARFKSLAGTGAAATRNVILVGKPSESMRAVLMGAGWVIDVAVAGWVIRRGASHRNARPTTARAPLLLRTDANES